MNYKEILEVLKEKLRRVSTFAYEDYSGVSLGLGLTEEVEQVGGEGQGDTWYSVKYFKDHDVYIYIYPSKRILLKL